MEAMEKTVDKIENNRETRRRRDDESLLLSMDEFVQSFAPLPTKETANLETLVGSLDLCSVCVPLSRSRGNHGCIPREYRHTSVRPVVSLVGCAKQKIP